MREGAKVKPCLSIKTLHTHVLILISGREVQLSSLTCVACPYEHCLRHLASQSSGVLEWKRFKICSHWGKASGDEKKMQPTWWRRLLSMGMKVFVEHSVVSAALESAFQSHCRDHWKADHRAFPSASLFSLFCSRWCDCYSDNSNVVAVRINTYVFCFGVNEYMLKMPSCWMQVCIVPVNIFKMPL